jgi:hypothetical protein
MSKSKVVLQIESESKDCFGVYELCTLIDGRPYIYFINSEYILRKVKSLIYRHKSGKAINVLKQWNLKNVQVLNRTK